MLGAQSLISIYKFFRDLSGKHFLIALPKVLGVSVVSLESFYCPNVLTNKPQTLSYLSFTSK